MPTANVAVPNKLLLHLLPALTAVAVACGSGGHSSSGACPGGACGATSESSSTATDPSSPSSATPSGASVAPSGSNDGPVTTAALVAVTLSPADVLVAVGTAQQYTAVAVFADTSKTDVTSTATWSVSDTSITSVTPDGLVTGLAPGCAVVTATFSGLSGSTPVTVTNAALQSISLSPLAPAVPVGVLQPFRAVGIFSDGTQQDLTSQVAWTSSDAAVATVSAAGVATPLATGSTVVQAAWHSVVASTSLQVTSALLLEIDVFPSISIIAAGTTTSLSATALFDDGSSFDVTAQATWSSDSSAAALLATPGLVRGASPGVANVNASLGGLSGVASVTVTSAVLRSLAMTPSPISTPSGFDVQLSVTGTFSDGSTQDLTAQAAWTSSDVAIASISNAAANPGLLTAISGGNATVTASVGAISASAPVTVTGAALQAIVVTGASAQLPKGYTLQLTATAQFDDGSSRDVTRFATWTSSSAAAGVYTGSALAGLVTGSSAGSVTITATLGRHAGTYSLTVTNARLQSIVASPGAVTLPVGGTEQLSATGYFDDGSTLDVTPQVTWRSQQKPVATVVTKGGLVAGLRSGSTAVTAKKGRITSAPISVTVN